MQPVLFILTLEDTVERRAPLLNILESHGIPYELWYGVDGRSGLPAEHESLIDRAAARQNLRREMGNAEFACALSHHFMYQAILDRGLDAAIILEDDAIVDGRFFDFLKAKHTFRYDLLLLDHWEALVSRFDRQKLGGATTAYRSLSSPSLATGYIITRGGAQKMVDQSLPIKRPADWPTDISKMQTYAVAPRLVDHPDLETFPSSIRQDRKQPRQMYIRQNGIRPSRFFKLSNWRNTYHKRFGKWVS